MDHLVVHLTPHEARDVGRWTAVELLVNGRDLHGQGRRTGADAAPQVLDLRYARGELDRETYLRMRGDLTDQAPAAR